MRAITGAGSPILLHTGTHTGIWGAAEVAFAAGVLLVSVGLVARLLLEAREDTPEARLVDALSSDEGSGGGPSSSSADGAPLDRRRD